jgi:hypothetical protein
MLIVTADLAYGGTRLSQKTMFDRFTLVLILDIVPGGKKSGSQ